MELNRPRLRAQRLLHRLHPVQQKLAESVSDLLCSLSLVTPQDTNGESVSLSPERSWEESMIQERPGDLRKPMHQV
jgi:hypothetical protein